MDPLTASAIVGGTGIVGSVIQNQANSAEAAKNRDFQREMSDTSHQRQVKDLRAAGLNPILSALGSGASTPGGAQATINDMAPGISKGIETAMAVKNMNADLALKEGQTDLTKDDAWLKVAQKQNLQFQTKEQEEKNKQAQMNTQMLRLTMPSMIKKAKAEGDFSQINQIMGIIKSGASSAADATSLLSPIKLKFGK